VEWVDREIDGSPDISEPELKEGSVV